MVLGSSPVLVNKACFQPDKVLLDKAFNIAKNPKYDRCQRGIASMAYKFFEKNLQWNSGKWV